MRWVRKAGLCLLAAFTLMCASAAGASAAAPEFGRCLKQAGGKFENGSCTKEGPAGKFEWFPGVVKNKLTIASKEATLITFETVGGTKMTCTGESSAGEFTGTKTVSLTLQFTGCETGHLPCTSAGQPSGTVVTSPLVGELGTVKRGEPPTKTKAGLEIRPAAGNVFSEFECGPLKVVIRGSLIVGWPANKMASAYTIKLTAMKGKQMPEKFEGGPVSTLEWSTNGGPGERVGLTGTLILTLEEKVELSTVN